MNLERVCTVKLLGETRIFASQDSNPYLIYMIPVRPKIPIDAKIKFKINKEGLDHKPLQHGIAHKMRIPITEIPKYKAYFVYPENIKIIKDPILPIEERDDIPFFKTKTQPPHITRMTSTCVYVSDGTKIVIKRGPNVKGRVWLKVVPQAVVSIQ